MLGKDGVQVMINGRLNYMPADALLAYLAGIPASDIIRLELITTPPANLDAEGNAGYIDIVLRRLPDEGLRGTYALTGGLASPRNGNAGEVAQGNVSATYRKGITSLFGGLSFNRNGVPEQSYLRRTVGEGNVEDRTNLAFERDPTRNVLNARFGADFALNESTTLGFLASGYTNQYDMSGVQRNIYGFGVSTDTLLITKLQEENNWLHFQSGVSLTKQLVDGGRISGGVDYLFYNNSNPIDYNLAYQSLDESIAFRENQLGSTKDSPFGIVVGKVDYLRPIGNSDGEFAIGAKLVIADFENDVALKREDVIDPAFSTASTLNESVSAAYAQYKASAKGFEYQVGLRYELTDTELDELSAGKLVDRNYGQLFPNVSVAFQATKRIKITAGFSRRINRPAFTQLAPFVVFLDPRTSFGGNPALQSSISNNLEIGASRGGWSLQLAYAVVDSAIASFQPVFDSHLGTQIIRPLNLREQTLYSATLGIPIRITSWWKGRLNATFTQQETVSLVDGADLTRTQGTFRLAGGQNFSLPNDFSLSLSGFYQGRNLNGYVNALPLGALNIALQKKLAAGRLTFTVDDVLNTLEFRNETLILDQNFVSERGFDFSRPTFKITWSAAFGNGRVKDANRDSAAEERGRVR